MNETELRLRNWICGGFGVRDVRLSYCRMATAWWCTLKDNAAPVVTRPGGTLNDAINAALDAAEGVDDD
jgi:hypothetical protein